MELQIAFDLERETKGAVRYAERSENPKIGIIYIRKTAFEGSAYPRELWVKISAVRPAPLKAIS